MLIRIYVWVTLLACLYLAADAFFIQRGQSRRLTRRLRPTYRPSAREPVRRRQQRPSVRPYRQNGLTSKLKTVVRPSKSKPAEPIRKPNTVQRGHAQFNLHARQANRNQKIQRVNTLLRSSQVLPRKHSKQIIRYETGRRPSVSRSRSPLHTIPNTKLPVSITISDQLAAFSEITQPHTSKPTVTNQETNQFFLKTSNTLPKYIIVPDTPVHRGRSRPAEPMPSNLPQKEKVGMNRQPPIPQNTIIIIKEVSTSEAAPPRATMPAQVVAPPVTNMQTGIAAPSTTNIQAEFAAPSTTNIQTDFAAPSTANIQTDFAGQSTTNIQTGFAAQSTTNMQTDFAAPSTTNIQTDFAAPSTANIQTDFAGQSTTNIQTGFAAQSTTNMQTDFAAPATSSIQNKFAAPVTSSIQNKFAAPATTNGQSQVAAPTATSIQREIIAPSANITQARLAALPSTNRQAQAANPPSTNRQDQVPVPSTANIQAQSSAPGVLPMAVQSTLNNKANGSAQTTTSTRTQSGVPVMNSNVTSVSGTVNNATSVAAQAATNNQNLPVVPQTVPPQNVSKITIKTETNSQVSVLEPQNGKKNKTKGFDRATKQYLFEQEIPYNVIDAMSSRGSIHDHPYSPMVYDALELPLPPRSKPAIGKLESTSAQAVPSAVIPQYLMQQDPPEGPHQAVLKYPSGSATGNGAGSTLSPIQEYLMLQDPPEVPTGFQHSSITGKTTGKTSLSYAEVDRVLAWKVAQAAMEMSPQMGII